MGESYISVMGRGIESAVPYNVDGTKWVKKENAIPNFITGKKDDVNESQNQVGMKKEKSEDAGLVSFIYPKNKVVSLAEKLKEIRALLGKNRSGEEGTQLQFEFSFEYNEEDTFVRFSKKTKDIENVLTGIKKETYAEIRQKIALQFKIGGSINSESLMGFTKGSEFLAGNEKWFDRFLQIVDGLFSKSNPEDWNEFFQGLFGLFSQTDGDNKFREFISTFLDQWLQKLFPNLEEFQTNASPATPINSIQSLRNEFQFQLTFQFEFSLSVDIRIALNQLDQQQDPIVVDLDGDGIELTNVENGPMFDIKGTGEIVRTAWIRGGDAFLAVDRNGNGKIDNGLELFGDQWGAQNGFEELRKLDTNSDGYISKEDRDYDRLLLWRDNGDGVSSREELFTLAQMGIERISLQYKNVSILGDRNNKITQKSFFIRNDGSVGRVADVLLNYLA